MAFIVQANSGNTISINAEQDGAFNDVIASGQDFVIDGISDEFEVTGSGSSLQLSVGAGQALIGGRTIRNDSASTINATASSTNYLVLRIDLSQTPGSEGMLYLLTSLSLLRTDNLNSGGTVHDLLLAEVTTDANGITSIVDRRSILSSVGGRSSTLSVLTTDWTPSTYGYSCVKSVPGVKSTDKVHFSVEVDMTSANYQAMINARAFVQDVDSGTDQVTIYATNLPTVNINLDIWGW